MLASTTDLLRLVAIPFFASVAYRDVQTRRVPNRTWYPLAVLAVVLLAWDAYRLFVGDPTVTVFQRRRFLVGVAVSLLVVVPLVYGFWLVGGFGGADAKAFFVIAVLFPAFPAYDLGVLGLGWALQLPYVRPALPVFSLTILTNTVLVGLAYPLALAVRNALTGYVSPGMFIAKPVDWDDVPRQYGTLLKFTDRSTGDSSVGRIRSSLSWRSVDLDAVRMYLQWRGLTLAQLRDDPDYYRDSATLPEEPNDPGDGIVTDGGAPAGTEGSASASSDSASHGATDGTLTDPWGAEAFLDDIEGSAYGTTPEELREGLDALVAEDVVWVSPGIPFLVPLFFGLVTALSVGDLLFAALSAAGVA